MAGRLKNKTAIVTGGTSGIGLKIVELFTLEGALVVFTGRDAERGASVMDKFGGRFVQADAAAANHAERIVDAIEGGIVDVLVNNAGEPGHRGGIETASADTIDASISVHLRAPWLLLAAVAPLMRSNGGGTVVNICSVAGQRVGAPYLPYSVAKAALLHLTRCAAADLGRYGIRVNSVSPGFISTSIHTACLDVDPVRAEQIADAMKRLFVSRQSLARTGLPEEVADAVLYLANDESRFVTGTDLVVDGGLMWGQYGQL
jgi:NAD(P)-dependent dehydrogenase (short-subunit alcohol dehydrogenase family)